MILLDNKLDLKQVGYDESETAPRSASFLIEDKTTRQASSRDTGLVIASMRQARKGYQG
jgi:hypothetical protein